MMDIDLRQMVMVLGDAVDLVGVDDTFHGKRVALMAVSVAQQLGWNEVDQGVMLNAGLLHDCGVSTTQGHLAITGTIDPEGSSAHCEKGASILARFAPLAHLAPIVLHHHRHWQDLEALPLPPATLRYANLLHLADRVDALAIPHHRADSILQHMDEIRGQIAQHRDTFFNSLALDAFLEVSRTEAFWLCQSRDYLPLTLEGLVASRPALPMGFSELKQFALTMAEIVDAKSPFTAQHSLGVARLASCLAKLAGLSLERIKLLEVAALLHDIGKLCIPDEILEFPSQLSPEDKSKMRRHSYATYQILRRIHGFEEMALWAAMHHESMNSNGYPFHIGQKDLPVEARILKVADVYQAMAQNRPYRGSWPPDQILVLLQQMQVNREVDPDMVNLVAGNLECCHRAAIGDAA